MKRESAHVRNLAPIFTCSCPEAKSRLICSEKRYLVEKVIFFIIISTVTNMIILITESYILFSELTSAITISVITLIIRMVIAIPGVLLFQLTGVRHVELDHKA